MKPRGNLTHPGFIAAYESVERQYPMSKIKCQKRSIDVAWIEVPDELGVHPGPSGFALFLDQFTDDYSHNLQDGMTMVADRIEDAIQEAEDDALPQTKAFLIAVRDAFKGTSFEPDEYFFVDKLPEPA